MIKKVLFVLVITLTAFASFAQKPEIITVKSPGDTTVLFTVKTVSNHGTYGPNRTSHVLAIWITNSSDQYVTTLKLNGSLAGTLQQYRNKLFKWKTYVPTLATPPATADCITGASLDVHTTHTVKWNGKNAAGSFVPDGDYNLWVEINETNISGNPTICIPFTKGTANQQITPVNTIDFQNIDLKYFAIPASIESLIGNTSVSVTPNPSTNEANIQLELKNSASVMVTIYSMTGQMVHRFNKSTYSAGIQHFLWNPKSSNVASGTYFVHVTVDQKNQIFKLIVK